MEIMILVSDQNRDISPGLHLPCGIAGLPQFLKKIPQFSEKGAGFFPPFLEKSRTFSNLVRDFKKSRLIFTVICCYIWCFLCVLKFSFEQTGQILTWCGRNFAFAFTLLYHFQWKPGWKWSRKIREFKIRENKSFWTKSLKN